jgi:hypothetical protein
MERGAAEAPKHKEANESAAECASPDPQARW